MNLSIWPRPNGKCEHCRISQRSGRGHDVCMETQPSLDADPVRSGARKHRAGRHAAARDLRMTPNVAMRQSRFIRTSRAAPRGQASIEYVVICLVLVLALFHGDPSPMDRMLSAIQHHYARFTYSMSLP